MDADLIVINLQTVRAGEVRAALERLALATGDPAYRRAARALMHQPSGRSPLNDARLIEDAEALLASGKARSQWAACRMVARARHPYRSEHSIAERLRRKMAAKKKVSTGTLSGTAQPVIGPVELRSGLGEHGKPSTSLAED